MRAYLKGWHVAEKGKRHTALSSHIEIRRKGGVWRLHPGGFYFKGTISSRETVFRASLMWTPSIMMSGAIS